MTIQSTNKVSKSKTQFKKNKIKSYTKQQEKQVPECSQIITKNNFFIKK